MKNIKFRAWNDNYKQLKEVKGIDFVKGRAFLGDELQSWWMLEHCIPMQYTGLKDKNNVEIYEGDIIKIDNESTDYIFQEVVFQDGCFCGYSDKKSCKWTTIDILIRANGVEIIGNKYETPELLKKVNNKKF